MGEVGQKIEHENTRQVCYQSGRTGKQWASQTRQLQADTMLQKERVVKTREREREKAGVFVESCWTGGFEGDIMCLISFHFKSEAASFPVSFCFTLCHLYTSLSPCSLKTWCLILVLHQEELHILSKNQMD